MLSHRFVRPLLLVFGIVLYAQDASLVLRTSVGYRTQRNSLPLTDQQKEQADQLMREANQANSAGKYGEAMRAMFHGQAVMRNVPWTPAYEFAASLQARADHAMDEPGKAVTVTLSSLYGSPSASKLTGSVVFVSAKKEAAAEKSLNVSLAVSPAALPFPVRVSIPDVPAGDYAIELRLTAEGDVPAAARGAFVKTVPVHIESLTGAAEKLRTRLTKAGKKDGSALPSAEYAMVLYDRADSGELNPTRIDFRDEFARASALLDGIEAGKDPFAGKHGDLHKAYRSSVDNTLQPYRLLVPEVYKGDKPTPLVVALHGMGGDENSMFDAYNGALKPAAERLGMLVVCPKGRDTASMYRGSAEQDVMDVLAEVRRDYNVDAARIYLMGHSMGGYGTWSVAMNHPDVFAALGPISGGGNTAGMEKIKHISEYVVHGDNDATVPVAQSRMMVEAGKKAGANIVYVEIPGGSHGSVVAPQFAPMLEFFTKQKKIASSEKSVGH
jgi:predicted esterase